MDVEMESECFYDETKPHRSSERVIEHISNADDLGDVTFTVVNYLTETMKNMYTMIRNCMLTDVTLEVGNQLFHAHKVVLAAASPYFKAMFTGGLKEMDMKRVKLYNVSPTTMLRLIRFMYTGQIHVTEVTVCQLLPAATMFQISDVIKACCAFLEKQLDPTNAIGIAGFAEQHGCDGLKQRANCFIERHFTQVCQEEEFLQLSPMQLIALIRKDELNVWEEREVYNAVLKWVKHDGNNRHPQTEHILRAVRCQFLTPNFLQDQMKNCDILRRLPACKEYLARIFKDLTVHKKPIVKERIPNNPRIIYIAGGYLKRPVDTLEGFNVDTKQWIELSKLSVPRSGLGGAFLKGFFYAVGGRNIVTEPNHNAPVPLSPQNVGYDDSDWVERYNPIKDEWRPCSPMSVKRNRVGVVVMDGLLYALGGCSRDVHHSSVERYDPDTDMWSHVQPMNTPRLGAGIAVVNRLLYAIGGFDGVCRLACGECYHPENNAWSAIEPMAVGRSGAGCAVIGQYIYVVGGFDGTSQLSSVERYDTETNTWTFVSNLNQARSALSVSVLDGKIYAMGGYDGRNFTDVVEVYDPSTNRWTNGTPLTSGRSGHITAVCYNHCMCASENQLLANLTFNTKHENVCLNRFANVPENNSNHGNGNGDNFRRAP